MKNIWNYMLTRKRVFQSARAFKKSASGSVLPFVALGIVMLTGATGTAIDMGRVQIAQARLQSALDQAGVAIGAELNSTPADSLNQEAQKYFNVNFPANYMGSTIGKVSATLNTDNTLLKLTVSGTVPTTVLNMVGVSTVRIASTSTVNISQSGMELVIVVDNSASMNEPAGGSTSKLAAAQSAVGVLLDILFGSTNGIKNDTASNLWVGLVPFSQAVNIGNKHSAWLDSSYTATLDFGPFIDTNAKTCPNAIGSDGITYNGGYYPYHGEYDVTLANGITYPGGSCTYWPATGVNLSFGLANWTGCVEARANGTTAAPQYDITDDVPSTKLFRPYYVPNNGDYMLHYIGAGGCTPKTCSTGWAYEASCQIADQQGTAACCNGGEGCVSVANCGKPTTYKTVYGSQCPKDVCSGTITNATCSQDRYTYYHIYNAGIGDYSSANANCPVSIQQMVSKKSTILTALKKMTPTGDTEINLGLAWAWRMLSPAWQGLWGDEMDHTSSSNPAFSVLPLPYHTPLMQKIVILMTDGDNNLDVWHYSAYGMATYNSVGQLGFVECNGSDCSAGNAELIKRTKTICSNMKAAGIIIYTIALGTDISSTGKNLLQNCASNPSYYFDSPTTNQLQGAFQKIADSLSRLRVSQ